MEYKLVDLVDIALFQRILDDLNGIYNFPSAILDIEGNVLAATAWQEICTKFHWINEKTKFECKKSDLCILSNIDDAHSAVTLKCNNGLFECVVPIIIKDSHMANFFTGQLFLEEPDIEFFKENAKKYGFDEKEYINAVKKVPIWTKEKLESHISFMKSFAEMIAGIGYKNLIEIEQRKLIEKKEIELKESNDKFKSIFDNSYDSIVLLKKDIIVLVNPAFLRLLDYSKVDEVIGSSVLSHVPIREKEKVATNIRKRFLKEGAPNLYETVAFKKSGEELEVEVSVDTYILNNEVYTIAILRNISERKEVEKKLRIKNFELLKAKELAIESANKLLETEKRLKLKLDYLLAPEATIDDFLLSDIIDIEQLQKIQDAFVEATGVASVITKIDGEPITKPSNFSGVCKLIRNTQKGRINCYNSDKIIGLKAGEKKEPTYEKCLSCGFIDAGAPIIVAGKQIAIWMIGQSNIGDVDEKRIREYALTIGADENKMIAEYKKMQNMSIGQFKKITNLLWILAQEISGLAYNNLLLAKKVEELKEIEKELTISKEKSEENNRLKTAFLQNMSHEIRTPMNAIMGFSQMLNKPNLTPEKQKNYSSIILNSSNQLLSILTDILTISSIETKQEKLNISEICLNNLVVELFSVFKPQAQNQNINLYIKQQLTDQEAKIYTDKTKLTQILSNLISNALKFTHEGFVEFGYSLEDGEVLFFVKDSGIGIEENQQDEIFERFRQADISINRKYGGTGLGLSISKGFVNLFGGKIWLDSIFGKGSTFYFTIPYSPVNNINSKVEKPNAIKYKVTILIAEDEEYNYLYLEELLINKKCNLLHAKDGQEAVEICEMNPKIGLVLMDIKMPNMNGYEAAKKIKSFRPEMVIIAQSAYATENEIKNFSGNIFDDYLTKPIDEEKLFEVINKYVIV